MGITRNIAMDSISLLGPPHPNKALNQEDFDSRFNYVRYRKKKTNKEILKKIFVTENWRNYNQVTDLFPLLKWIKRYDVKAEGARDLAGSLLIAALMVPQGIGNGVLVGDVMTGLFSILLPQFIYIILGSARHSSVGSLSYSTFLVYSSTKYSGSSFGTLTLCCGIIQLLQFLLPLEFFFGLISSSLLMGFSTGIYFRICIHFLPKFIIFQGNDCEKMIQTTCFSSVLPCLKSVNFLVLLITLLTLLSLLLFKWKLGSLISKRVGSTIPHEFFLVIIVIILSYYIALPQSLLLHTHEWRLPSISVPSPPSVDTILDSLAISLFSIAAHMKIAKSIAMEKMHKVCRKQELLSFSVISLFSSLVGLIPSSSSPGNSQINVEAAKYSLTSNLLSTLWISLFLYFATPLLSFIPLCVVGALILVSFTGIPSEIKVLRSLWYTNLWDAAISTSALVCAVLIPNSCLGFLVSIGIAMLTVVMGVQWPNIDVLVRVSDAFFAEEKRYEGECLDTPVRILRINTPLLFVNCETIRQKIYRQAVAVKGLIGIGIGTRTASLRSQGPVGPKDSVAARSSMNLTNIIPPNDSTSLRFIILDCSGVSSVDTDAINMLTQVYVDLNNDHIKLFFAGLNACNRDYLEITGFYSQVPRNVFFPTVQEALSSARIIILPFHMSVSMNGCRDVIALSTATSNQEMALSRHSPEAV